MQLHPLSPQTLNLFANNRDILRDLFTYLDYVEERGIKRMTRSNGIPQTDLKRIAKLMDIEPPEKDEWGNTAPHWINFIDFLALNLDLVSFDTKGEYRGYTSSEPSFIDNYILVNESNLNKFTELSPAGQEKKILHTLIHSKSRNDYSNASNNEFYRYDTFSSLDRFGSWGCATGIMPTLNFPEIRKFLLEALKICPAGTWVSTESLVAHLKANHPYFLIPRDAEKKDKRGNQFGRYDNFYESQDRYGAERITVPPNAPDAFERVEGRYVERFLEGIPLTMRLVEVGYDPNPYKGLLPQRGMLKAFRVTERFHHLMSGEEYMPKVTVQPNFDVIIESDFYPARIIRQVAALGEQVSSPQNGHGAYVGIFLLKKAAVAAAQVKDPTLDVTKLLKTLTGRDLPPNVQIELDEWAGHAEQFTLYEGFSLLETTELPPEIEKFVVDTISPSLSLVRGSEKVFSMLETLGHVPARIQHPVGKLAPVMESAQSVFPKESAWAEAQKTVRQVRVQRVITVSYQFPDAESFAVIQKTLAELRCPFQSDPVTRTVNIQQKEQEKFDEAVQKMQDTFAIELE